MKYSHNCEVKQNQNYNVMTPQQDVYCPVAWNTLTNKIIRNPLKRNINQLLQTTELSILFHHLRNFILCRCCFYYRELNIDVHLKDTIVHLTQSIVAQSSLKEYVLPIGQQNYLNNIKQKYSQIPSVLTSNKDILYVLQYQLVPLFLDDRFQCVTKDSCNILQNIL